MLSVRDVGEQLLDVSCRHVRQIPYPEVGRLPDHRLPDPFGIYRTVFRWDPEKATRNLEKHGVTFFEAASIFSDPEGLDLADEAHSGGEQRSLRIGLSDEGRVLTVVYMVRRSPDGEAIRIISARRASRKERAAYARRED